MRQIRKYWTKEETDELLKLKDLMTASELGDYFHCSKRNVIKKLARIRNSNKKEKPVKIYTLYKNWTEDEDNILLELRPSKSVAELSKILNRTEPSIKSRLKILSIRVKRIMPKGYIDRILECDTPDQAIILSKELDIPISYIDRTRGFSGKKRYKIFSVWESMLYRCQNKNSDKYHRYGGRGISVCDEWKNSFETFYNWSKISGYKEGLTIDRIDNNSGYKPSNCRWVTNKVNANNREMTILISAFGEIKCISDWAEDPRCAVTRKTLCNRLDVDHQDLITNEQKISYNIEEYRKLIYSKRKQ